MIHQHRSIGVYAFTMIGSLVIAGCAAGAELNTSVDEAEIFGGGTDFDYKFPWSVDVTVNPGAGQTTCAGVLVAPRWVLTAATCTGTFGQTLQVSYQRTNASGSGENDWQWVGATALNSDANLLLMQMANPLNDPLALLQPATLPWSSAGVGQSGTVVSGHPGYNTVKISTPTIASASTSTFTASSANSSLCSTDRGAGFLIQDGSRQVVAGVAIATPGSCNANNVTWTAEQIAPFSQWIHDITGYWGGFDIWANAPGAKAVSGDFNGDGKADIALAGGVNWTTIPVAFSSGDGYFTLTNSTVSQFPSFANAAGARLVAADLNGDGKDDLFVTGASGMSTIPIALSNGDGSFNFTNVSCPNLPTWAVDSSVKVLAGDIDNDGDDDIILTGGSGWSTIPVAFSYTASGNLGFVVTNNAVTSFPALAQVSGAKPAVSDVNGDGKADVVLVGGSGWSTVPTALSNGSGTFTFSNPTETNIAGWSPSSTVKVLGGCRRSIAHASHPNGHRCDVNNDTRSDILLTGGASWTTIPVGYRAANGTMFDTNASVSQFPTWAQDPNAKIVSGDFNGDRRTDIALVGGTNWWTVPVAYSATNGTFTLTNKAVY